MLGIEREFAIAIWGLYAIDCIHWLKPGEIAITRGLAGKWKVWKHRETAFTLLGRMPILTNPFDLRPGLFIIPRRHSKSPKDLLRGADQLSKKLGLKFLLGVVTLAAVNLLVLLPSLLLRGWFEFLWRIPIALLAVTHIWIAIEVFHKSKDWRKQNPGGFWPEFIALVLNPVGGLRCCDLFSKEVSRHTPGDREP